MEGEDEHEGDEQIAAADAPVSCSNCNCTKSDTCESGNCSGSCSCK